MGRIRLGVSRLSREFDDYREWATLVDRSGFDLLGYGDSQARWGDPYPVLGMTAAITERVTLGTFVSNAVTRHPAISANAIGTVQALSGGRAFFGIGVGESSLRDFGQRPPTPQLIEKYVSAVRDLLAGRSIEWEGQQHEMLFDLPHVPVWVAGDGPRTLQLAGRIGDAAIVGNGATPELVRYALDQIRIGAESVGRDASEIDVWWMTRVMPAASEAEGFEALRFYLASYAFTRYRNAPRSKGLEISDDILQRLEGLRSEFRYAETLRPDLTFNADLVDKYGLREWLGRQFAITGPRELCIERIREVADAGSVNIIMPQLLPDVVGTTRELAETILPAFQ